MTILSSVSKHAPALAASTVAIDVAVDLKMALVIAAGLVVGVMARTAQMIEKRKTLQDIKQDLLVSCLVGGANAILAAMIIWQWDLHYLQAIVVAALCSYGGVRTIDAAWKWAHTNYVKSVIDRKESEDE
jgi:hypothetical protein